MIDFTDDVSGVIVGGDYMQGFLTYEGRKQGSDMYAVNEDALKVLANEKWNSIKKEHGQVFRDIYPSNAWMLEIV